MIVAGIEAGGTKFVVGISNETGEILERIQFDTTTPSETMEKVITYLKDFNIDSIGLGSFGPIDLHKSSDTYGYITSTPKSGWENYNIIGKLKEHFNIPIAFDTDVNAAALGEAHYGVAKGYRNVLYITIGTGIGAGALVEGNLVHGMLHPEMGHILINQHQDDDFGGVCPFHGNCFEGLASGTAINKRYGQKAQSLQNNDSVWKLEGYYVAQALINYIMIMSPQKIIIGGGVSKQDKLFEYTREYVKQLLNNYLKTSEIDNLSDYITRPLLGDNAGLTGCIALAIMAINKES